MRFARDNDAIARAAQRRVNPENHANRLGARGRRRRDGTVGAPRSRAAQAILHLFKLPQGDAHEEMLPATADLQKEKRRRPRTLLV